MGLPLLRSFICALRRVVERVFLGRWPPNVKLTPISNTKDDTISLLLSCTNRGRIRRRHISALVFHDFSPNRDRIKSNVKNNNNYNYFLPMYLLLKAAYVLRQTKYAKPKAKHPGKSLMPNANSA